MGNLGNEGCVLKKVVSPIKRREVAMNFVGQFSISQRRSCELVGVSRSSLRYQRREDRDDALRARLKVLASTNARYG